MLLHCLVLYSPNRKCRYQQTGTSLEGHLQFLLRAEDEGGPGADEGEIKDIPTSCFTVRDDEPNAYKRVRIKRKGGISVDMCNFQFIGEVGDDAFVRVGAGVTRNALNEALRCVLLVFSFVVGYCKSFLMYPYYIT